MTVDLIGTEVCSYRILELVGEGGMATVWRAQNAIGKTVAIKTLDPLLARDGDLVERFRTEAQIQLSLGEHPNIVAVENFSLDPLAMVMEFVQGRTLADVIDHEMGAIPIQTALPWIRQVLSAVEHAHARQVVHRDIKPSNILITTDDRVKVMDFGIAKVVRDSRLTRTGATLGTAGYMSPEQIKGSHDADARSDVYSLGVTFYEMLAGRHPFDVDGAGDSDFQVKLAHVNEAPPDPRQYYPAISAEMVSVLFRALEKDPDDRYKSAADLLADMEAVSSGAPPVQAPRQSARRSPPQPTVVERSAPRRVPAATVVESAPHDVGPPPAPKAWLYLGLGGAAVFVLALGLVFTMRSSSSATAPSEPAPEVSTEPKDEPAPPKPESSAKTPPSTPAPSPPPAPQPRPAPSPQTKPNMVAVPAGSFTMGSSERRDEQPRRTVFLSAFQIDKYEVSVNDYRRCVSAGACDTYHLEGTEWRGAKFSQDYTPKEECNWGKAGKNGDPMNCVSWQQADTYCRWAGKRLPTEAQWEKAARGTSGHKYPWGNTEPTCYNCNFKGCNRATSGVKANPRGASPYGALNMAGNVREWVNDHYSRGYYRRAPSNNPTGPSSGRFKSLRGGSWADKPAKIRAARRHLMYATDRGPTGGFRCAFTP